MVDVVPWSIPIAFGQHESSGDVLELGADHTFDCVGGRYQQYDSTPDLKTTYFFTRIDGSTDAKTLGAEEIDYGRRITVTINRTYVRVGDKVIGNVTVREL